MNEEMAWVLQAQQGSDEAFTHLVETYQTPVYNLCYRMLGEPDLAEDAAQETLNPSKGRLATESMPCSKTWIPLIALPLSCVIGTTIPKLRSQNLYD